MGKETNENKCRFLTPEFRVSYPHVFKAKPYRGKGNPKFSLVMLFPKKTDLKAIKEAMKEAKIAKFGPDQKKWPKDLVTPVKDGDDEEVSKGKEGYAGHWVISATAYEDRKPLVVDPDKQEILNPADFYPGCYARAQLFCSVWDTGKEMGIKFSLNAVQKTREGKPLSMQKDPDAIFGDALPEGEEEDDGGF